MVTADCGVGIDFIVKANLGWPASLMISLSSSHSVSEVLRVNFDGFLFTSSSSFSSLSPSAPKDFRYDFDSLPRNPNRQQF